MRAFHPPFYLLSHWHTPLSIPTFGFCRAKNERYIKRFGKRWGGCRGRRKEPYKKAGGTPKGFFFSTCNKSVIFYNTAIRKILSLFFCKRTAAVSFGLKIFLSVLMGDSGTAILCTFLQLSCINMQKYWLYFCWILFFNHLY